MVEIGFESGEQVVFRDKLQPKAVAGFSFVRGDDFQHAAIVGGDEQRVGVLVREVTLQAREMLLDHGAHGVVGRVGPAVDWDVD